MQSFFLAKSQVALAYSAASIFRACRVPLDRTAVKQSNFRSGSLLLICHSRSSAEHLLADISCFVPQSYGFFSWDMLPFEGLSPTPAASANRIEILIKLLKGDRILIVSTPDAIMQSILSPKLVRESIFKVNSGQRLTRDQLIDRLDLLGYTRASLVEEPCQFAARGGVIDFFPPGSKNPIRAELFGDLVESLRNFSLEDQRSVKEIKEIEIFPAREFLLADDLRQQAFNQISERASELNIPRSSCEHLFEAISQRLSWPGLETLLPIFSTEKTSLLDYLDVNTNILISGEKDVNRSIEDFESLVSERAAIRELEGKIFPAIEESYFDRSELAHKIAERSPIIFELDSIFSSEGGPGDAVKVDLGIENLDRVKHLVKTHKTRTEPLEPVVNWLKKSSKDAIDTVFIVSTESRAKRLRELLEAHELNLTFETLRFPEWLEWRENHAKARGIISICLGEISSSCFIPSQQISLVAETDIFTESRKKRVNVVPGHVKRFVRENENFELEDHVVHIDYGIAKYKGLKTIKVGEKFGDFLHLEYAEGAKLYLPAENISKVHKYVGVEGCDPKLSLLGGGGWSKARKKVEQRVAELAGELLQLYAEREVLEGISFGELDQDDLSFSDGFPYEATPDQGRAIEDVLADLEKDKPMDRLVCGDVGYGKTEVALRAAFKVANFGRQVALLVPTTVLASQHFESFKERYADYPIEIGLLSRFNSSKENKAVLEELKLGKIDIVIGTHRLLQKDVAFKDLGLLIIDEEHRFGVTHKEKLKKFKRQVDVLTLTATPIPRTLQMSLLDIRDLSVIETPPNDRQVTRTYVASNEDHLIKEALQRELSRSGQVFFLHNRVQTIESAKQRVEQLVPNARIAIGHGQMKERELEIVMQKFFEHEIDILICTTIIESGLDISNANTIIIEHADRFGLAELYQLRGRVGRSSRRAYCYLLVDEGKDLGPAALKRLRVLRSLDDLGVGFRLALQDMEIRGAGNLLGKDQSGNVNAVGFDLFARILKKAVQQLRQSDESKFELQSIDPEISIGFPAFIPEDYIPDVTERLLLYQKLVQLEDRVEGQLMAEEIFDLYGRYPPEVDVLLELMIFRSELRKLGIEKAMLTDGELKLNFHATSKIDRDQLLELVRNKSEKYRLSPSSQLVIKLENTEPASPQEISSYVEELAQKVRFNQ